MFDDVIKSSVTLLWKCLAVPIVIQQSQLMPSCCKKKKCKYFTCTVLSLGSCVLNLGLVVLFLGNFVLYNIVLVLYLLLLLGIPVCMRGSISLAMCFFNAPKTSTSRG